jgi:hypothetical protein
MYMHRNALLGTKYSASDISEDEANLCVIIPIPCMSWSVLRVETPVKSLQFS